MGAANLAFLFRLLVSHFLADFPLQPNGLYRMKTSSFRGSVLHGSIFGVVAALLVAPSIKFAWWAVALLTAFHIAIDHLKVRAFLREGEKENILSFLADQAAHIGAIVLAAHFWPSGGLSLLKGFLLPDKLMLAATFVVFSAFGGTILLRMMARTIWPDSPYDLAKGWREWSGVVERGLTTGLVIYSLWPLAPIVAVSKGLLLYLRLKPEREVRVKILSVDIMASALLAAALGWTAAKLLIGGQD